MIDFFRQNQIFQSRTRDAISVELPDACISLRRTAIVALAANAWTNITWQAQIRGQQITWNGTTTITLPADGYYQVSLSYATSATTNTVVGLIINATIFQNMGAITATTIPTTAYHASMTRYFSANDTVAIRVYSTNAVNLNAVAENSAFESPILHVIQLTRTAL
jgi:glycine/D-amino acid oxidase-like deaminating enzyme